MNTANKLTMARIVMIPLFLVVLYMDMPGGAYVATAIFAIAAFTDFVDGYIARHFNQVTNFGKFMDPLADKMLTVAALCYFVETGKMLGWILAIVLLREFAVSGMRLVAVEQGCVIAAAWSGKVKTATTMVCICVMLLTGEAWMPMPNIVNIVCQLMILGTTVYSGIEYFAKNKAVWEAAE